MGRWRWCAEAVVVVVVPWLWWPGQQAGPCPPACCCPCPYCCWLQIPDGQLWFFPGWGLQLLPLLDHGHEEVAALLVHGPCCPGHQMVLLWLPAGYCCLHAADVLCRLWQVLFLLQPGCWVCLHGEAVEQADVLCAQAHRQLGVRLEQQSCCLVLHAAR